MSCTVYDYIFKGWNQPIIGIFTLPIGQLMQDLADERKEETAQIENIIEKLNEILASNVPIIVPNYKEEDKTSEYSEKEERKKIKNRTKQKKKGKKVFKGSEMESELGEALGANEQTGNFVAKAIVEDKMEEIKKKKALLSDTSQVTGQSGVSNNTNATPQSAMSKKF